jgi:hypothetical protein
LIANARLAKTLTTATVAPFLRPPYQPLLSQTRIGIFAESSGAFGVGAAWGYNQARARLARSLLPRGVARLEKNYHSSIGVNVFGALGWFPLIDAPPIAPTRPARSTLAHS